MTEIEIELVSAKSLLHDEKYISCHRKAHITHIDRERWNGIFYLFFDTPESCEKRDVRGKYELIHSDRVRSEVYG